MCSFTYGVVKMHIAYSELKQRNSESFNVLQLSYIIFTLCEIVVISFYVA